MMKKIIFLENLYLNVIYQKFIYNVIYQKFMLTLIILKTVF